MFNKIRYHLMTQDEEPLSVMSVEVV